MQRTSVENDLAFTQWVEALPFPLALTFEEYIHENNPYIKVHRLVDAAEILTRFAATVFLNDLLQQFGAFPKSLRKPALEYIERPSFGAWRSLLEIAHNNLRRENGQPTSFVKELPEYIERELLPALGSTNGDPAKEILALRNIGAHLGRFSDSHARELLKDHEGGFTRLFSKLAFLADYEVFARTSDGEVLSLRGPHPAFGPTAIQGFPSLETNHVVISRQGEHLDLFPLQVFAEVYQWRDEKMQQIGGPVMQLYNRSSKKGYLEFTPLSNQAAFAHHHGKILERFREMFPLDEWRHTSESEQRRADFMFDELLTELGEVFVGRQAQLEKVKNFLRAYDQGVLWISGKPGVGKSALMARLIQNYRNASQHYLVIPYFFRVGHSGCSTEEFIRAVLVQVQQAMGGTLSLAATMQERRQQFVESMRQAQQQLGKKILLLVDGIDEIYRIEPAFVSLLFAAGGPNILWLCAGRSEPLEMESILQQSGAISIFPGGLPVMEAQTIRAMLTTHLERLKYQLFERDEVSQGEYHNRFVEVLVRKSEGLPLYVRMVIDDLCEGKWTLFDEDKLPEGLKAYFEQILEQLGISSIGTVLTPLFCLLAWAKEPVLEPALGTLLSRHHLSDDPHWHDIFRQALENGHLMLRRAPTPEGQPGWTFYHDTFRQHLLESNRVGPDRSWAERTWLTWCSQWSSIEEDNSVRLYALRNYPEHLFDKKLWSELFALARDESFYRAQVKACPNQPELPLYSLQLALRAAMKTDNASAMAEFMLRHAERLTEITQETPLDALRAGHLNRAWEMSDLHEIELCVLWHFLLAWQLHEADNKPDATRTLQRLLKKRLPLLSTSRADMSAKLLVNVFEIDQDICMRLQLQLLNDDGRVKVCENLTEREQFVISLGVAQTISQPWHQSNALAGLALALTEAGNFELGMQTAAMISENEKRAEVLRSCSKTILDVIRTDIETGAPSALDDALRILPFVETTTEKTVAQQVIALEQIRLGQFREAIKLARVIVDPKARNTILCVAAVAQAEVGEHDSSLKLITSLNADRQQEIALYAIGLTQVQARQPIAALKTVQLITDSVIRSEAVSKITNKFIQLTSPSDITISSAQSTVKSVRFLIARTKACGPDEQPVLLNAAVEIGMRIKERGLKNEVLREIANALANARMFQTALQTARYIREKSKRKEVIRNLAAALLAAKKDPMDLVLPEDLLDQESRDEMLSQYAIGQAKAGMVEDALKTAQKIESTLNLIATLSAMALNKTETIDGLGAIYVSTVERSWSISKMGERLTALKTIASAQIKIGRIEDAKATLKVMLKNVSDLLPEKRIEFLKAIAYHQKQAGLDSMSQETFQHAIDVNSRSSSAIKRAERFFSIAAGQKHCGFISESIISENLAMQSLFSWHEQPADSKAARRLAVSLVSMGQYRLAAKIAQRIKEDRIRLAAISEIAIEVYKRGNVNKRRPTKEIIDSIEVETNVRKLQKVARLQEKSGDRSGALETLDQTLEFAECITRVEQRINALVHTATKQQDIGGVAAAEKTRSYIEDLSIALIVAEMGRQAEKTSARPQPAALDQPAASKEVFSHVDVKDNAPIDGALQAPALPEPPLKEEIVEQSSTHETHFEVIEMPNADGASDDRVPQRSVNEEPDSTRWNEVQSEIATDIRMLVRILAKTLRPSQKAKRNVVPLKQSVRGPEPIELYEHALVQKPKEMEGAPKDDAILNITVAQIEQGNSAAALSLLPVIKDDEVSAWVLQEIAMNRVAVKDFSGAMELGRQIKVPDIGLGLIRDIAEAQADAGLLDDARQTLNAAEHVAHRITDLETQIKTLHSLAIARFTIGEVDAALSTFLRVRSIIDRISSLQPQVTLQLSLAESLAQLGFGQEAAISFSSSMEALNRAPEPERKQILQKVAMTQIEMGQFAKASGTIKKIAEGRDRVAVLIELAIAQARSGEFTAALQSTQAISEKWQRPRLLSAIAVAQAEAGLSEDSQKTFVNAIDEALEVKEKSRRELALRYVALALAEAKDFAKAVEMVQFIEDEMLRIESFEAIAVGQARIGKHRDAESAFLRATEITRELSNEAQRATALRNIAIAQTQAGLGIQAIQTVEGVLIDRSVRLTELATSLVATGQREPFKHLLLPCSYYPDASLKVCGLLARMYPNQVTEIAHQVLDRT